MILLRVYSFHSIGIGSLTSGQCGTGGHRGRHGHHGGRAEQPRQWTSHGCCYGQRCGHGKLSNY